MHSNFMSDERIIVSIFYKYEREISSLAMGKHIHLEHKLIYLFLSVF